MKNKSQILKPKKIQIPKLKIFEQNIVNPINNDFLQFFGRKIFILPPLIKSLFQPKLIEET